MKCKSCRYLMIRDTISLMSQMMGYTAECSKTGILFNLDRINDQPLWCPLREDNKLEEKL